MKNTALSPKNTPASHKSVDTTVLQAGTIPEEILNETRVTVIAALEKREPHILENQSILPSLIELKKIISSRHTFPTQWEKTLADFLEKAIRHHGEWERWGESQGKQPGEMFAETYSQEQKEAYQQLTSTCSTWNDNSLWAGWYPHHPTDTKDSAGNTFKFYATPSADPKKILTFIDAFPELVLQLDILGTGRMVGVKIPPTLAGFVGLNDRLVIHFYDPSLKEVIARTVQRWAIKEGISLSPRTHSFGIDREPTSAPKISDTSQLHDPKDSGSFTQRVARKMAQQVANAANGNIFGDDQLTLWTDHLVRTQLKDAEF